MFPVFFLRMSLFTLISMPLLSLGADKFPHVEHHDPIIVDSQLSLSSLITLTLETILIHNGLIHSKQKQPQLNDVVKVGQQAPLLQVFAIKKRQVEHYTILTAPLKFHYGILGNETQINVLVQPLKIAPLHKQL